MKQLTVADLRRMLGPLPDDAWIYSEGCDCVGPSGEITYDKEDNSVVINRNDSINVDTHESSS